MKTVASYDTEEPGEIEPGCGSGLTEGDASIELEEETMTRADLWEKMPTILRWVGGVTLVVSAMSFIMSGWMTASPFFRYFNFLGFTSLLTACGIFCVVRWKDDKGARTFLALAAAFLPAHFAQLGAMIYAEVIGGAANFPSYYRLFQFDPVGTSALMATLAVAIVVLAPVAFLGFSAMARVRAKPLTAIYFLANIFLLLPIRDGDLVAVLGFGMLSALIFADRKLFASHSAMRSWDGVAVRTMLFVPLALLAGRTVVLYDISYVLMSFLSTSLAVVLFMGLPRCLGNRRAKEFSQFLSLVPAFFTCHFAASGVFSDIFYYWGHSELYLPLVVLPFAIVTGGMSFFVAGPGVNYRRLAAFTGVTATMMQLMVFGGLDAAILCVITAVAVILGAFLMEEKRLFYMGIIGLVYGVGSQLGYVFEMYQQNVWISLAITGTVVILLSSYIERNGRSLLNRTAAFRKRLNSWK